MRKKSNISLFIIIYLLSEFITIHPCQSQNYILTNETVVYVNINATGANNGNSWNDAFNSIQKGIDEARPKSAQVWVAKGTYQENLVMRGNVGIYGGFQGNETSLNQRNYNINKTIIDGRNRNRVIICYGSNTIDGFTIRNGYVPEGSGDVLKNRGGGILFYMANGEVRNNFIINNFGGWGGGIYVNGDQSNPGYVLIEYNFIFGNTGTVCGGGVEINQSRSSVRYNTIVDNVGFGLEIPMRPSIILGDFHSNIIDGNEFNNHERFSSRPKGIDVWAYARACIDYSFIGEIWDYDSRWGSPFWHSTNIYGDFENKKPMFVNREEKDFRLKSNSPCIGTGKHGKNMGAYQNKPYYEETVTVPNILSGPSHGEVGESLNFSTGGSISSYGHSIEYQFKWGDDNNSSWGIQNRSHSYQYTGTYEIQARARCKTHTNIVSNWSDCHQVNILPRQYSVTGEVLYYSNFQPVGNATLIITGDINKNEITNMDGTFNFSIEAEKSFCLSISKSKGEDIGPFDITSYDAVLTARHALGLEELNSYQQIAADVDRDGKILTFDATLIARYVVELPPISTTSYVSEWFFSPETRGFLNISSNESDQNFVGIICGNVHGGWTSPGMLIKDIPTSKQYEKLVKYNYENKQVVISLFVESGQEIFSSDIEIVYDPEILNFAKIEKTNLSKNFQITYNNLNNRLLISMYTIDPLNDDGALLKLYFENSQNVKNKTVIELKKFLLNDDININLTTEVILAEANSYLNGVKLTNNYPNPFNQQTTINFELPKPAEIELLIYNTLGIIVKTLVNKEYQAGSHFLIWDGKNENREMVGSGTYLVLIKAKVGDKILFQGTKKMTLIK
ncbi:MAG: FlgD immunoglobulin-like domain containing protein [bacterium]|nr:FlgD immunoglobulin-like domain containing protein [bacterium]